MDRNALEAPCGIHCGLCALNQAVTDPELRRKVAEQINVPTEKAACQGCRAADGHCPVIGEQCATWLCSKQKGLEFCSECIDFPCAKLMPCADRADKLPHNIKVYSLALRKARGAHEWESLIRKAYDLYFRGQMVIGQGPRPKA